MVLLYLVHSLLLQIISIIIITMVWCTASLMGCALHDILFDFFVLFILIIKVLGLGLQGLSDGNLVGCMGL